MKSIMIIVFLIAVPKVVWGNTQTTKHITSFLCKKYNAVDCELVHSIIWIESNYRNITAGDNGSLSFGPAQIKCETARMVGLKYSCEQLRNPVINIRFAIYYINSQYKRYQGDLRKTIASYNAGSAIVCKNYNKGKCYPNEFINEKYVWKVWRRYKWLKNKKQERLVKYLWHYKTRGILKRFPIGYKLESQIFLAATMGSF